MSQSRTKPSATAEADLASMPNFHDPYDLYKALGRGMGHVMGKNVRKRTVRFQGGCLGRGGLLAGFQEKSRGTQPSFLRRRTQSGFHVLILAPFSSRGLQNQQGWPMFPMRTGGSGMVFTFVF